MLGANTRRSRNDSEGQGRRLDEMVLGAFQDGRPYYVGKSLDPNKCRAQEKAIAKRRAKNKLARRQRSHARR